MSLEYSITYKAENSYENWVHEAYWQFLIIPEANDSQEFIGITFNNSINAANEYSINGYGFQTIRVHPKQQFKDISFEANFRLIKKEVNPFDFEPSLDFRVDYNTVESLEFKVDFEAFLGKSHYTTLPNKHSDIFLIDKSKTIFENLKELNHWTYRQIYFKTGVTDVLTGLEEVLENRHGVCQDFSHLFCALARVNGIPSRYVSGYLHQGNGYFGDSHMHAWAEAYVPGIGWVGFDPTNDLLANTNHIKVCHGKDYMDCAPLKGIVLSSGTNETKHSVVVESQQQQ